MLQESERYVEDGTTWHAHVCPPDGERGSLSHRAETLAGPLAVLVQSTRHGNIVRAVHQRTGTRVHGRAGEARDISELMMTPARSPHPERLPGRPPFDEGPS